jgi:hypothetical protein
MSKCGRVELLQITNDAPPYWFVMIRNFNPDRDIAPGETSVRTGREYPLIDRYKHPVWRFLKLDEAKARFVQLSALPWCVEDEAKRQNQREKSKERLLRAGVPFQKKSETPDA